jgi:glycosyltransferase involved in cell wall biosynthesis
MTGRRVSIITGIFPPDIGGPATSVPALAGAIQERGDDVTVITLADRPGHRTKDLFRVDRIARTTPLPLRIPAVVKAVVQSKPDVVFANGLHLESAMVPRVPLVQKIVGDWAWERATNGGATKLGIEEFQSARVPPRVQALRELRSRVTRRAHRVVVPSRYLARIVAGWGVHENRIDVIPNAAPPVQEPPTKRPTQILYVGRLVPWKHVDHVLRVLPRLPNVGLTVIGDGPTAGELQRLSAELRLTDRVDFVGSVSKDCVLRQMREEAGVLVLPSSYEGMPHVVLEAFAAALPVVASEAGGTPELVIDGVSGLSFPCGDLGRLTEALEQALVPGVAAHLAQGGAEIARRHRLDAVVTSTIEVLDRLLTEKNPLTRRRAHPA